jgi:hypothetical protein
VRRETSAEDKKGTQVKGQAYTRLSNTNVTKGAGQKIEGKPVSGGRFSGVICCRYIGFVITLTHKTAAYTLRKHKFYKGGKRETEPVARC